MKASVWFWAIGVFALLWTLGGMNSVVTTLFFPEQALASATPEQIEYFENLPLWREVTWAIAVSTSLLASVLLLLKRALAVPLFMIAPVSITVDVIHDLTTGRHQLYDAGGIGFTVFLVSFALFLVWYARREKAAGVLS